MPKTVFIIPGFKDSPSTPPYRAIAAACRKKGWDAVVVPIRWERRTMSDYVDQFLAVRERHPGTAVVLGFSFGAMIAAIAAERVRPEALFLCSLSPYFAEDLRSAPRSWRTELGERRWADFKNHAFADVARGIRCPTHLFLGGKEAVRYPTAKERALEASREAKGAVLHVIVDGEHSIRQHEYLRAVQLVLDESL